MAALPGWKEFSSKLVKWTCLCELYPYRMSLLVLIVLDFEQKAAMNRLAHRREKELRQELKRQSDETKPRAEEPTSFYRYEPVPKDGKAKSGTQSKSKSSENAEETAKDAAGGEVSFVKEAEFLSTIYNRLVERFLYSHKLSESMLRTQ